MYANKTKQGYQDKLSSRDRDKVNQAKEATCKLELTVADLMLVDHH